MYSSCSGCCLRGRRSHARTARSGEAFTARVEARRCCGYATNIARYVFRHASLLFSSFLITPARTQVICKITTAPYNHHTHHHYAQCTPYTPCTSTQAPRNDTQCMDKHNRRKTQRTTHDATSRMTTHDNARHKTQGAHSKVHLAQLEVHYMLNDTHLIHNAT